MLYYASIKWGGGGGLFETIGVLHEAWIFEYLNRIGLMVLKNGSLHQFF
jgi:hypothetical protein